MKKLFFLLIALLAVFAYTGGLNFRKFDVIRIGTECDYAPQNWQEKRATSTNVPIINNAGFYADGYDIQIAKIVADKLGAKLEVKKIAWQELLPALNRREIDAVFSAMLDTDERKTQAAFSDTYEVGKTEYAIVVNKNSKFVNGKELNDFYGAVLIGQKGTNLDNAIEQVPGAIHLTPVETAREMIEKLVSYEVDGVVMDVDAGHTYERQYRNLTMVRFPQGKGFILNYTGVCAAVRKKDKELLDAINEALSEISPRDRRRIMDRTIAREWENTL